MRTKSKNSQLLWLFMMLTMRELKGKYKSAYLGFLWAFLNPLVQMLVLSIVFSLFFRISIPNYPLFLFSGLLPWTFFSLSFTNASSSLVNNRELLKKTAFMREAIPASVILANLANFFLSLGIFLFFLIITGAFPEASILLLPFAIILQTLFILGLSLLTSSLNIYYRDVAFIVQALVLVWFYLTPIFHPISYVPKNLIGLYNLNPMVGIITFYQFIFLKGSLVNTPALLISIFETFIFLILGIIVFRKRSKYFADWA